MKSLLWASLFVGVTPALADPCTLAGLTWMHGVWRDRNDVMQVEERWTIGPDDRLLGSSWLLHPGRAGGVIEAETITSDSGTLALRIRHFDDTISHAREEKDAPMLFLAARCDANAVVFDGQGPQAGEHIGYRREGDHLTFVGDFLHQGKPIHVEETFLRAGE